MSLQRFKQDYPGALAKAMREHPADYHVADSDEVARRMIAAIERGGIGSVNINSHSFKMLAKQYGIKNTYKEWRPFLAGKDGGAIAV